MNINEGRVKSTKELWVASSSGARESSRKTQAGNVMVDGRITAQPGGYGTTPKSSALSVVGSGDHATESFVVEGCVSATWIVAEGGRVCVDG